MLYFKQQQKLSHHLLVFTSFRTRLSFFRGTYMKIFQRMLVISDFHRTDKILTFCKISSVWQVWNILSVSKWWKDCFNFWVNFPFQSRVTSFHLFRTYSRSKHHQAISHGWQDLQVCWPSLTSVSSTQSKRWRKKLQLAKG